MSKVRFFNDISNDTGLGRNIVDQLKKHIFSQNFEIALDLEIFRVLGALGALFTIQRSDPNRPPIFFLKIPFLPKILNG